jgi:ribosomal protein S18 acetylase RimI-like enzyme
MASPASRPSYSLSLPKPSDLPELAAIQTAGFASDLRFPALRGVSTSGYTDWALRMLQTPEVPAGTQAEVLVARSEDGQIVGWGLWSVPDGSGASRPKEAGKPRNELPNGMDGNAWDGFRGQIREFEWQAMGDSQYICMCIARLNIPTDLIVLDLHILVVHPDYQGRGAGRALLRACTESADAAGLPAFVCGSPVGKRLYESVGFKVVKVMMDEDGSVITNAMKREPQN